LLYHCKDPLQKKKKKKKKIEVEIKERENVEKRCPATYREQNNNHMKLPIFKS
jgi:hypothetical protein